MSSFKLQAASEYRLQLHMYLQSITANFHKKGPEK